MPLEPRCPQCLFLSRELGEPTPCLLHIALVPPEHAATALAPHRPSTQTDYDEPYTFGQLRPTVDRPVPFSLREYAKLQLLRTRIQANPSPLDEPAQPARGTTPSRR